MKAPNPLIIAGMHRSGTSLAAQIVNKLGVNLGENLVPADKHNRHGYLEDEAFIQLHRKIFKQWQKTEEEGWPDWGWQIKNQFSSTNTLDTIDFVDFRKEALKLIRSRSKSEPWGWKDPRTTLFLDEWYSLCPDSLVIGVYRNPWDVARSMEMLHPPIFAKNPEWCMKIWIHYNLNLLQFALKHPAKIILINSNELARKPIKFINLLKERFLCSSLDSLNIEKLISPVDFQNYPENDTLVTLYEEVHKEAFNLLTRLNDIAALPGKISAAKDRRLYLNQVNSLKKYDLAVVIPTHNQGDYLIRAIASIERESKSLISSKNIELLIVNDGTNNSNSSLIIKSLSDLGYRFIHQENQGLSAARNTGINNTSAPIILPLDDDNEILSPYLRVGLEIFSKLENLAVIYGDRIEFGLRNQYVKAGANAVKQIENCNNIDACALISRKWLERVGGYRTDLRAFEDWDLWIKIKKAEGIFCYLETPCLRYRVRPNSMLMRTLAERGLTRQQLCKIGILPPDYP